MTSTFSRTLPWSGVLGLTAAAGLALAVALGCGKSEAAPPRGTTVAAPTPGVAAAKAETDNYVVEVKPMGDYKAGAEAKFEVTLVAKGGYHTNAQYPYKFKTTDPPPPDVTYPKPILQRADGTFEEKSGSFKVPFTAAKAGKLKVGGTFHLSVCSEANCMMDKVPLELDVDVK